jgi:hypothetical protein
VRPIPEKCVIANRFIARADPYLIVFEIGDQLLVKRAGVRGPAIYRRRGYGLGRIGLVKILHVLLEGEPDLSQVRGACRLTPLFAGLSKDGKQHRCDHRYYSDNDQQLYQCKAGSA